VDGWQEIRSTTVSGAESVILFSRAATVVQGAPADDRDHP
jgi:hypothetical protein